MAITWTIIVLGALLHGMKCDNSTLTASPNSSGSTESTLTASSVSPGSTVSTHPSSSNSSGSTESTLTASSVSPGSTVFTHPSSSNSSVSPVSTLTASSVSPGSTESTHPSSTNSSDSRDFTQTSSTNSPGSTDSTPTTLLISRGLQNSTPPGSTDSTPTTSLNPTKPSLTSAVTDSSLQHNAKNSLPDYNTTRSPTIQPNTSATLTVSTHRPQSSTVISSVNQDTPNSSIFATTTHKENGKTPLNQTDPSAVTTNPAPYSKSTSSQSIQTPEAQTTSAPITSVPHPNPHETGTRTSTPGNIIYPVFDLSSSSEGNVVLESCKTLGQNSKGNCSVILEIRGNKLIATVTINADQKIPTESYKPPEKNAEESKETIPDTLVAILASSGALVFILCCFAAYCTCHRRSYRKNQQHLTEEMQTVENGYHDNPTLEVMEVQPEMQEKKLAFNGEFNDSWIVPIDNLLKDDIPDEEDTHL